MIISSNHDGFVTAGFLVIPNAVPEHQLAAARAALDEGAAFVYTADPRLDLAVGDPRSI